MNLKRDYLFCIAKCLTRRLPYRETLDIIRDYDSITQEKNKCLRFKEHELDTPDTVSKAIYNEKGYGKFGFKISVIVSLIAILLLGYLTLCTTTSSTAFTLIILKHTIFVVVFSALFWVFINGHDLSLFSVLNSELLQRKRIITICLLLSLIPILVLSAAFGVLRGAINIDVYLVGPIFHSGVIVLSCICLLTAVYTGVLVIKKSVWYYCVCVNATSAFCFCSTYLNSMRCFSDANIIHKQLFMCLTPYVVGLVITVAFAIYIKILIRKGNKIWMHS